jgi:hypothetical protein
VLDRILAGRKVTVLRVSKSGKWVKARIHKARIKEIGWLKVKDLKA